MAQKRNAGRLPKYDPRETDARLSVDLRAALKEKLTLAELIELEKQLRRDAEKSAKKISSETFSLSILIFSASSMIGSDSAASGRRNSGALQKAILRMSQKAV